MAQNDDFGSFLAGFLIGGLAGAVTALLMAPQSGEETRKLIQDKGVEFKDRAIVTYEEAIQAAEKAAEDARVRAEELAEIAKERAMDLKQRGQVVLEEQISRIETVIDPKKDAEPKADAEADAEAPAEA